MPRLPGPFIAALWRVENAIKEHRRPKLEDLITVLRMGEATPVILDYLYAVNEGKPPFTGRTPRTLTDTEQHMHTAMEMIRAARHSSPGLSWSAALEAVAAKQRAGYGRSALKEAVRLFRALHDGQLF